MTSLPKHYDAVLGGTSDVSSDVPTNAAVLGGFEGVRQRYLTSNVADRIIALNQAQKHGASGAALIANAFVSDPSPLVIRTAVAILNELDPFNEFDPFRKTYRRASYWQYHRASYWQYLGSHGHAEDHCCLKDPHNYGLDLIVILHKFAEGGSLALPTEMLPASWNRNQLAEVQALIKVTVHKGATDFGLGREVTISAPAKVWREFKAIYVCLQLL